jgi:hypothetical protein
VYLGIHVLELVRLREAEARDNVFNAGHPHFVEFNL